MILIALLGAAAGQGVIGYTGQFYTLFYLEKIAKVDGATANIQLVIALIISTPTRSEEHTSELQSLMRISYAVFCLKKKKKKKTRIEKTGTDNKNIQAQTTTSNVHV